MAIKRKTVTYLKELTADVVKAQSTLMEAGEMLDSATFDLASLDIDTIRTDINHVKRIYDDCNNHRIEVNRALVAFKNACDKYKEFF